MFSKIIGAILALVVILVIVASYYVNRLAAMKDENAVDLVLNNAKKAKGIINGWIYPVVIVIAITVLLKFIF